MRSAAAEILVPWQAGEGEKPEPALLHELRIVRQLLSNIERRVFGEAAASSAPKPKSTLSDDSIVDQRCVPAPKELYLRLARQGAFPSNKIGKRVVARWGDVRAAFLDGPGVRKAPHSGESREHEADGLDDLRRQLGLVERG